MSSDKLDKGNTGSSTAVDAQGQPNFRDDKLSITVRDTVPEIEVVRDRMDSGRISLTELGVQATDDQFLRLLKRNFPNIIEISKYGRKFRDSEIREKIERLMNRLALMRPYVEQSLSGTGHDKVVEHTDREIKRLLQEIGVAEMLVKGDWSIESSDEKIRQNLGIRSLENTEILQLNFLHEHGVIDMAPPESYQDRLVHIHLGCGNGAIQERLRRSELHPFGEEGRLRDYYVELGYADKIYFLVSSLLQKFVRAELQDNPAVREFIEVLSSLLMRDIYYRQMSKRPEDLTREAVELDNTMQGVPYNINKLKKVLPRLRQYMDDGNARGLGGKGSMPPPHKTEMVKGGSHRGLVELKMARDQRVFYPDGEFLHDMDTRSLSEECRVLIERATANEDKAKAFWGEILDEAFFDEDLSEYADLRYYDLVLGRFEELHRVFQEGGQLFALAHSNKGFSHLDEKDYATAIIAVTARLINGGMLIDNGFRGSSWMDIKLPALVYFEHEIRQAGYGNEFKVSIIADAKAGRAVLIERGIKVEGKGFVFFTDEEYYREELLAKGFTLMSTYEYLEKRPEDARIGLNRRFFALKVEQAIPDMGRRGREAMLMGLKTMRPKIDAVLEQANDELGQAQMPDAMDTIFERPEVARILRRLQNFLANVPRDEYRKLSPPGEEGSDDRPSSTLVEVVDPDDLEILKRKIVSTIPTIPERYRIPDVRMTWADEKREFRVENLPRNKMVPSLDLLEEKQRSLQERLWRITSSMRGYLSRKPTMSPATYKPISLIEFKECFTNRPMRKLMRDVLGGEGAVEYMDVYEVDLQKDFDPDSVPDLSDFQIMIFGGSLSDTEDEHAQTFIQKYFLPLMQRIRGGAPVFAFGTCFSHQGILEAFGRMHGMGVQFATVGGAIQFGGFPIRVPTQLVYEDDGIRESHNRAFKYMRLKENNHQVAVTFTRSGYTYVDGYEKLDDISAIAFDITGRNEQSSRIPPVAFDLFHGKVITAQFHPEEMLSQERHRQELRETLNLYAPSMQMKRIPRHDRDSSSTYPPYTFYPNVDLEYRNALGSVRPWIVNDIGHSFMMGVLDNFTIDMETAIDINFRRRR